jgi:sensor histidine kinase YesM
MISGNTLWLRFSPYSRQWQAVSGLMIYITLASIVYFVEINKRLQQVERQRILAEAMTTEAELRALRAQLNPHFLFNTLHSLMVLVKQNPDVAEEAIEQLSDMLRYTLRVSRIAAAEGTALCEELIMVEKYLALESLRAPRSTR